MTLNLCRGILFLVISTFVLANVSAQDRNYPRINPKEIASLTIEVNREDVARVMLSIPAKVEDRSAIEQALCRSLSFPLTLDPPRKHYIDEEGYPDEQDADEEDSAKPETYTLIEGRAQHPFAVQGMLSSANIRAAELTQKLQPQGIKTLWVMITVLKPGPNPRVTGATKYGVPSLSIYQARISTDRPETANIEISFGYRRSDLVFQLLPVAAFILIPLMLTLWMSWSAQKRKEQPAEMWGRHVRFLSLVFNSIWLIWIPIYSWSNLTELSRVLLGPGARTQVATWILWFGPPVVVMWLCHLLSFGVYRNVRGAEWSPAKVIRRSIVALSVGFIPLLFMILAVSSWRGSGRSFTGFLAMLGVISAVILVQAISRTVRLSAYSVTSGELHDRVFQLAARAGVKLKQIYVLPPGEAQMSNAFARSDNAVMLTSSLLRHLSKREVNAIMGHEIGHLKEKHPQRRITVTIVTIVITNFLAGSLLAFMDLQRWGPAIFSLALGGATLVLHFLSRSNERHADAIGINLTGDPEALIAGLAKISRLNLMPMHEGGAVEFGTHPRTLGRLQDIARVHGISPERLQVLLKGEHGDEDFYQLPKAGDSQEKIFSTAFKQKYYNRLLLVILGTVLFPPVLIAFGLGRLQLNGGMKLVAYLAGAAGAFFLYQAVKDFFVGSGFGRLELKIRAKFSREGLPQLAQDGVLVGLAPASQSRRYQKLPFWDMGLLGFSGDQMFYLGEEARFVLQRAQIIETRMSVGEASFAPRQCLYVVWRNEAVGSRHTFYLMTPGGSALRAKRASLDLDKRIQNWLKGTGELSPMTESIPNLNSPAFAPVTCEKPKTSIDAWLMLKSCLTMAVLTTLIGFVFHLHLASLVYAIALVSMQVVLDELPKLFYGSQMNKGDNEPQVGYQSGAWLDSNAAADVQE